MNMVRSYITWRVMSKLNPKYRTHNVMEKGLDEALLSLLTIKHLPAYFMSVDKAAKR